MVSENNFIERLGVEFNELAERHNKLFLYLSSDISKSLDYEHRQLLIKQERAMRNYRIVLVQRLARLASLNKS